MRILEINRCRKHFGNVEVLTDISLSVDEGQVVSIIGPSGSGKSTLLRCATLLETMDGGELSYLGKKAVRDVDGRAVYASTAELKQIRSCFGLVFQNFNLFPQYTALQNVSLAPRLQAKANPEYRRDRRAAEQAIQNKSVELLRRVGLGDKLDFYPHQLSGGQQQRVAIARALALTPDVLFFDEPTSALDPELTGEVLNVIRQLAQEDMTMVIVTHEMSFAAAVSDTVLFIDGGVIVEQGPPSQVLGQPREERTRQFLRGFQKN